MPKTKEQKQKIISELKDKIAKQKAMVFVGIAGLKVNDLFDLRKRLKKVNASLVVVKKTLIDLAFKEQGIEFNKKLLEGQPAVIFGFEDEISPAKIAHQFSLKNENLKILGGYFDSEFKKKEEVIALAQLPSKQELLSRLVGSVLSPMSGLLNVLQGNIRNLIYVLKRIEEIKRTAQAIR